MKRWLNGTIADIAALKIANQQLTNTKRGRQLLILTGSHVTQHFDYVSVMNRPSVDTMLMNFSYLLPEAEKATHVYHGSVGYTKTFNNCFTFKHFCKSFKGKHIFMMATKHSSGGPYPIPTKASVITTVRNNNISNYNIVTHGYLPKYRSQGFGYVPTSLKHYSASIAPFGCLGTLNAMVLPLVIQMGYSKIYIVGLGDAYQLHFYDVAYVQPHLRKPMQHSLRGLSLQRYRKLNALAASNNTQIIVVPKKHTEKSIQEIFQCANTV